MRAALKTGNPFAWPLELYKNEAERFRAAGIFADRDDPDIIDEEDPVRLAREAAWSALPEIAKRGGTKLPPDWTLPDDLRRWAIQHSLSHATTIDLEVEEFRTYWHRQQGAKSYRMDWRATWRRWWRKATEARTSASTP